MGLNITGEDFEKEVLESKMPVLTYFYAPWWGVCTSQSPIIDQLIFDSVGRVKIVKIMASEEKVLSRKYKIMSIPAMLLFKDGQEVKRLVGYYDLEALKQEIGI